MKTPWFQKRVVLVCIQMQQLLESVSDGRYDKVLRENLEKPGQLLLHYFFNNAGIKTESMPNRIRQHILEKETDTLVLLKEDGKEPFIFHLEFQSTNDSRMAARMASYDFMLHLKYDMEVVSAVIYTGEKPMKMNNTVSFNGNHYACRLIDIREMDPEIFLRSDKSKEVVLAILAGGDSYDRRQIIRRILTQLQKILPDGGSEMIERIKDLEILSGLRNSDNLQQQIITEVNKMPIVYDIRKDLRFQEGVLEGQADGIVKGRVEGVMATATNMKKRGLSLAIIQECTGLSISVIEELDS